MPFCRKKKTPKLSATQLLKEEGLDLGYLGEGEGRKLYPFIFL
jgi:hypothetical protein